MFFGAENYKTMCKKLLGLNMLDKYNIYFNITLGQQRELTIKLEFKIQTLFCGIGQKS